MSKGLGLRQRRNWDDNVLAAEAALKRGESVRFMYTDNTAEPCKLAVNFLIECLGARVAVEDPFGEPAWVELELLIH
jgi:hypothetical protein